MRVAFCNGEKSRGGGERKGEEEEDTRETPRIEVSPPPPLKGRNHPAERNCRHSSFGREAGNAISANYTAHFTSQIAALRGICWSRTH